MTSVTSCPKNSTEVSEAAIRLGCGTDKYSNNQYVCLPNTEKTSLVEMCYNGVMGFYEKGHCLEVKDGQMKLQNCSNFLYGCPDTSIRASELYKNPACLEIETTRRCYTLDRLCLKENYQKFIRKETTAEDDPVSVDVMIITLCVIIATAIAVCLILQRKKSYIYHKTILLREHSYRNM
uniref:Uncharacterized protein LOC111102868 isoform X1 n=1 Tax=Crassostrea virginica TaxID=6565 RepID=A0A8B8AJZ2_CRAVI|nr:uncharacterized protein LOC111102868 isoform X1 [Crassostrea virginica]